jgi:hypothetical protein
VRIGFSRFLHVFLVSTALALLPAGSRAEPVRGPVLVLLQNDAKAPDHVTAAARAEVVRLFDLAGIEIAWVTSVPPPEIRLRVVSLVTWEPREEKMVSVLGLTYGNHRTRATRGYVFWRRVERAASRFTAALPNVLAVAIAHELGHMLLPDGTHASQGIMTAPWNSEHFGWASAGLLHFSRETAALMRRRLMEGVGGPGDGTVVVRSSEWSARRTSLPSQASPASRPTIELG